MRRAAPRVYDPSSLSAAHLNQKPLQFVRRILNAVTDLVTSSRSLSEAGPPLRWPPWSPHGFPASAKSTTTSPSSPLSALRTPGPGVTGKPANLHKISRPRPELIERGYDRCARSGWALPELVPEEGDRRTELAQRVGGSLLVLPGFF